MPAGIVNLRSVQRLINSRGNADDFATPELANFQYNKYIVRAVRRQRRLCLPPMLTGISE
jgi:hypothetical protein